MRDHMRINYQLLFDYSMTKADYIAVLWIFRFGVEEANNMNEPF